MLQHQIVQSPARLGLTNPNSPSLPNSTPPKFPSSAPQSHHHPSSNAAAAAPSNSVTRTSSSSSALISLLPPLPRAQSLLLQMASLVSKLFEVSPNRTHWLTAFRGNFPTFLASQVQSAPPLESSPSSVKEILTAFNSLQTQLFEAVAELQEILDLQDAKQRIAKEIKSRDSQLLGFANKLREAERVLDILVDDYADFRRAKRTKFSENGDNEDDEEAEGGKNTTVASQLKMSDILSYAHRISYTTFAPPEFGAGQGPLRGALAPAPQDEQMRASQLYNFADLDVGLPKAETKEKAVEAIIEPPPPALDALAGLLPNITVPSGWKPGMPVHLPVDLPVDLPVPPPGWKPGDPVHMDSIPVPRIVEQHAPRGLHKQSESIQVRHVQIDILDQDEDSTDYSSDSDDGSSDDED